MPSARFQPSFAAGVLGPALHGRIDLAKYDVGLKVGVNVFIHAHGGVSNRAGTEYICDVMDHAKTHELIPFKRDDDENYILLFGDLEMKVIDLGLVVQSGGGDYVATTPFASTVVEAMDYVQSVDVMFLAHQLHFPQRMERVAIDNWTFANLPIDPILAAPTGVTVVSKTTGTLTYTYKVSPVTNGVEGFAAAEVSDTTCEDLNNAGAENVISWSGFADEYNIYRERNGVFGFVGFTTDLTFTDDNISPDLNVTPVEAADIWTGAGEYPAACTLIQQRLTFANSVNQPETFWAGRIGDYGNFTKSRVLKADDRMEIDLSGQEVNRIRHMVSLRELLLFASAGEFSATGPGGVMTATNPIVTQYGYSGSSGVKPLVVEDTAIFVDRTGRSVRDFRYAFEQDGYSGNDLTVFAPHYFESKQIKTWAFAKNPFSVVWVALDDGTLLSFTYKREHQVWAWCEHDLSGGLVESIAVVPEGTEDAVYFIVKRTINSATVRYVERLHTRDFTDDAPEDAYFVDSGITYDGAATTSITGLDHLEGEEVVVLADGSVVAGLTVASGAITLPNEASKVHVGLAYESEIENLPPAIDLQDVGSARGRPIKASRAFIQVEKTRGIQVGPDRTSLTDFTQTAVDLALTESLFTGMLDLQLYPQWNRDGTIVVKQTYPLPMTILGISPELSVGRTP